MSVGLHGRIAVVTGAGSGIGRASALALAQAGARVVAADIDGASADATAAAIGAAGGEGTPGVGDVADPRDVAALFDLAEARYGGPVDVVHNNAGIEIDLDVVATSFADWQRTLDVNLSGVLHGCRELIRRARAAGRPGVAVNTASVNGFYADLGIPAYCASKGAVIALTRSLARDHAAAGIRVNCICPGFVETPLVTRFLDAQPDPDAARVRAGDLHAVGRLGEPREIADAVVFLASDAAAAINGQAMVVDGGMTIGQRA